MIQRALAQAQVNVFFFSSNQEKEHTQEVTSINIRYNENKDNNVDYDLYT